MFVRSEQTKIHYNMLNTAKSQLKADVRKDDLGSFPDLSFAALLTKSWRWGRRDQRPTENEKDLKFNHV
jgi:hypothetical protein